MTQSDRKLERAPGFRHAIQEFLKLESAGGILLVAAAALALIVANSPLGDLYKQLLGMRVAVIVGALQLDKMLLHWVNDGLMAVFFMLVGLEIKREILEGELSSRDQIVLPALAAVGGLLVPAALYMWVSGDDVSARNGWAIPTATDIAFALGVLTLLGSRLPVALKVFLLAIAIIDDIAAIVIIAIFYSEDLSLRALIMAGSVFLVMVALNRKGVARIAAYVLGGVFMWVFMIKSGVHATLAGVLTAICIPLRTRQATDFSPLHHLEHTLHPWVAFGILPVFAFANAGVSFEGLTINSLLGKVSYGIEIGLLIGKPVGIFMTTWLAVILGIARRPPGVSWGQILGVSILCGIGFTMSLFLGGLAFEHGNFAYAAQVRIGVLVSSIIAALVGFTVLRLSTGTTKGDEDDEEPR